jgi:predicted  nucleic acid-binding Zn-ribbon protein
VTLNEEIDSITREQTQLSEDLNAAKMIYDEMKQDYENKLKNIEASIKEADEKDRVISGLIKELTPDYEAKCDVHEAMEKDYDQTKLKFFGIINNLNNNLNTFK